MPKHDKPILDVSTIRINRDHFRHWETCIHDYCLLEGYRNRSPDHRSLDRSKKTIRASRSALCNSFVRMEHSRQCNRLQDSRRRCPQALNLATKNLRALRRCKYSHARQIPLLGTNGTGRPNIHFSLGNSHTHRSRPMFVRSKC